DHYNAAGRLIARVANWQGVLLNQMEYAYDSGGRLEHEWRLGKDAPGDGWFTPPSTRGSSGQADRTNRPFKLDSSRDVEYDGSGQVKLVTLTETVRDPSTGLPRPGIEYIDYQGKYDANGGPVYPSLDKATAAGNHDRTQKNDIKARWSEVAAGQEIFRTKDS